MAARGKGKHRAEEPKARQSAEIEVDPLVLNKWDTSAVKNGLDDTAKKVTCDATSETLYEDSLTCSLPTLYRS